MLPYSCLVIALGVLVILLFSFAPYFIKLGSAAWIFYLLLMIQMKLLASFYLEIFPGGRASKMRRGSYHLIVFQFIG